MDRLSVLDAEFLHLEDDVAHMHIAGVCLFNGPAPTLDELTALVAGKLHLIPRYRQVVQPVPLELGRPVWIDDEHFNIGYHIRHTALPQPGDDTELCTLMARLMSQRLDRRRPLWEIWLVEGLADDQWALVTKVHHCMVDGVSGVDLLTVVLDIDPGVHPQPPEPWNPAPRPSGAARVVDAWAGLADDLVGLARRLPGAARVPLPVLRSAWHDLEGLVTFGRRLINTPPLSIEGSIGPHRLWCHSSVDLDDVRAIRAVFGGTINDVVLAACAGGYRALLLKRGEDVERAVVRTLVPVSVRAADAHGVLDNRVSALLYELPVGVDSPIERLGRVQHDMAALKASHMAEAGEAMTTIGGILPPIALGAISRTAMRVMHVLPQRSINTVTTNVPGPQFPLYCLGREMIAYYPFVPISHGVRIGTAILSYNGHLSFGVTGDFDTAGDIDLLADAIRASVMELHSFTR